MVIVGNCSQSHSLGDPAIGVDSPPIANQMLDPLPGMVIDCVTKCLHVGP